MMLQPLHLMGICQAAHELSAHFTSQQQAVAELLVAQCDGPRQRPQQPVLPAQLSLQLLLQSAELIDQACYHSDSPRAFAVPAFESAGCKLAGKI